MARLIPYLLLTFLSASCAGGLEDPGRFDVGTRDCVTNIQTEIFDLKCATVGCHAAANPAAGLDLASPGVGTRVATSTTMGADCLGDPLISRAVPESGVFYRKVQGTSCGAPMPYGAAELLPPAEIQCVLDWVSTL